MDNKHPKAKFSLGTLFLICVCIALATGWILEKRNFEKKIAKLHQEQLVLQKKVDLTQKSQTARIKAIEYVSELTDAETANSLIYALSDPNESVRSKALDGLKKILIDEHPPH